MKPRYLLLFCFFIFAYVQDSFAQNVGINTDDPEARLHVKRVGDTIVSAYYDFENQVIPPTFINTTSLTFVGDAAEGQYALSSLPYNIAEIIEIDLDQIVGADKQAYVSYYIRYELEPSEDLIFGSTVISGPASSDWIYVEEVMESNIYLFQGLFFEFSNLSFFEIDSLTIRYDTKEDDTFKLEDGFQGEGKILVSDESGNARWDHGLASTAAQIPFMSQNQLYLTGKPTPCSDKCNEKEQHYFTFRGRLFFALATKSI